jgi:hypothetical protein
MLWKASESLTVYEAAIIGGGGGKVPEQTASSAADTASDVRKSPDGTPASP